MTAEYQIACPPTFDAQAIKFGPVAPGWTPFAPSSLTVQEGFIVYGPPQSLAYAKTGSFVLSSLIQASTRILLGA